MGRRLGRRSSLDHLERTPWNPDGSSIQPRRKISRIPIGIVRICTERAGAEAASALHSLAGGGGATSDIVFTNFKQTISFSVPMVLSIVRNYR